MSGFRFARGKPIFCLFGGCWSASKAGAMIDPRKSFKIFGSRTEMAADMKKLLCNFYMHVGECNQSNRKRSHTQVDADQMMSLISCTMSG